MYYYAPPQYKKPPAGEYLIFFQQQCRDNILTRNKIPYVFISELVRAEGAGFRLQNLYRIYLRLRTAEK